MVRIGGLGITVDREKKKTKKIRLEKLEKIREKIAIRYWLEKF